MDAHMLTLIGAFFTLYHALKLFYKFYYFVRLYIFPTYPDFSKYGQWSVVTGSATGLGKAFAMKLASKGQNIILIDRDGKGIKEVSKEISSKYGVETMHYQVDFSEDESFYKEIEMFLQDYDIGVLVNNVGMAHPPNYFTKIPDLSKQITLTTKVNMLSTLKMIQMVLPGMEHRKRGCIINVSSMLAFFPMGKGSLYGASKAFIKHLSLTLSDEYKNKGIVIQCCCPYFLKTDMTKFLPIWENLQTPEDYISSMLATVGKERVTFGSIQALRGELILRFVPRSYIETYLKIKENTGSFKRNQEVKKQN